MRYIFIKNLRNLCVIRVNLREKIQQNYSTPSSRQIN
jgi:hypothetical protein